MDVRWVIVPETIVSPVVKEKNSGWKVMYITHSHTQDIGELALNPDSDL